MHELYHQSLFEQVLAHAFVVEFRKSGLPHAHILLILSYAYKFNRPKGH